MRRALLIATLLAACADDELPNADPPELHDLDRAPAVMQTAASAVVRITHPNAGSGTGSFISADGLLLTNAHVLGPETCAREGCTISLTFQHQRGVLSLPPRTLFAVPQHVDVGLDMAAVQIFRDESKAERLPTPFFLTFAPREANELVGEHITAIGHPLARLKKMSSGIVVRADGAWFDAALFSLPGGSGSPLLNDEGQIVGLLHRGAEGFDQLTSTSAQVLAVGSASAEVQRALSAPLPASMFSLDEPMTADEALARSSAFIAASRWKANVDGQPVSLAWLMGTDCDEGLGGTDYTSYEALMGALSPCFAALELIECRAEANEASKPHPKECPRAELDTWKLRLYAASSKQRAFNGMLDLAAVSFSMEGLADSQMTADSTARANLLALLADAKPRFDFSIASYLAAYGIDSYDGQSVRDLFVNYRKVPFYERWAWEIATSVFWLYAVDQVTRDETLKIVKELYRDPKLTLGARLRIEDLLYNADEL